MHIVETKERLGVQSRAHLLAERNKALERGLALQGYTDLGMVVSRKCSYLGSNHGSSTRLESELETLGYKRPWWPVSKGFFRVGVDGERPRGHW